MEPFPVEKTFTHQLDRLERTYYHLISFARHGILPIVLERRIFIDSEMVKMILRSPTESQWTA